ncbi:MAG: hypothetical protein PHI98_04030 [Eubacteriales bacterium]|nr:hypothetical protein [Eubacteriales bacterium]
MTVKSKTMERVLRGLITLLGAGIGAALTALLVPFLMRLYPDVFEGFSNIVLLYVALCALCGAVFFGVSLPIIKRSLQLINMIEQQWEKMPTRQILLTSIGLLLGLAIAALVTQLILSVGASLLTVSFSALTYIFLGYIGMQLGFKRYRDGKGFHRHRRKGEAENESLIDDATALFSDGEDELGESGAASARKYLDTSVIIDGRILDVA